MATHRVINGGTTTPVLNPGFGSKWLIPEGASGDWSTREGKIAVGSGGAGYVYITPAPGDTIYVIDTEVIYLVKSGGELIQISPEIGALQVVIGNGVDVIEPGLGAELFVPFDCDITGWSATGDQEGSISVEVRRASYANYPPTGDDAISGEEPPSLVEAQKNQDLDLTTWDGALSAGDRLHFVVNDADLVTMASIVLHVEI